MFFRVGASGTGSALYSHICTQYIDGKDPVRIFKFSNGILKSSNADPPVSVATRFH